MIENIVAYRDRVIVKVDADPQAFTSSGLFIPEVATLPAVTGRVMAMAKDSPMKDELSVGDRIIFPRHLDRVTKADRFKLNNDDYVALYESDMLCKIISEGIPNGDDGALIY